MSLWTDTSLKTEKTRRHGRKRRQGKIWRRRRGAEGVNRKETNDAEGNDTETLLSPVYFRAKLDKLRKCESFLVLPINYFSRLSQLLKPTNFEIKPNSFMILVLHGKQIHIISDVYSECLLFWEIFHYHMSMLHKK